MSFSPPWAVLESKPANTHVVDGEGNTVIIGQMLIGQHEERARLIAAAPEMYEQIKVLAAAWHFISEHPCSFDACVYLHCPEARALLARIDGEVLP
jgi:hypothetical protein